MSATIPFPMKYFFQAHFSTNRPNILTNSSCGHEIPVKIREKYHLLHSQTSCYLILFCDLCQRTKLIPALVSNSHS